MIHTSNTMILQLGKINSREKELIHLMEALVKNTKQTTLSVMA